MDPAAEGTVESAECGSPAAGSSRPRRSSSLSTRRPLSVVRGDPWASRSTNESAGSRGANTILRTSPHDRVRKASRPSDAKRVAASSGSATGNAGGCRSSVQSRGGGPASASPSSLALEASSSSSSAFAGGTAAISGNGSVSTVFSKSSTARGAASVRGMGGSDTGVRGSGTAAASAVTVVVGGVTGLSASTAGATSFSFTGGVASAANDTFDAGALGEAGDDGCDLALRSSRMRARFASNCSFLFIV
mmetsp:Transcript_2134/g.6763  ORF Transcript_2134/g.6763 Transcript_2134/m.6763 type:complete len:248 (-) Transcript_2134:110-853(-)